MGKAGVRERALNKAVEERPVARPPVLRLRSTTDLPSEQETIVSAVFRGDGAGGAAEAKTAMSDEGSDRHGQHDNRLRGQNRQVRDLDQ